MNCPAPGCIKGPLAAATHCAVGSVLLKSNLPSAMSKVVGNPNNFVVAFCGSGTGHLTQAMKVVEMLKARGYTLTGVVTDSDASEHMLDEMVRPLGVELLIIPAIQLVDTEKGFVPIVNPPQFVCSILNSQKALHDRRAEYAAFFSRTAPGRIYDMYHLTLARFFQLNPLPPSISIVHMAAQFGLCALTHDDTTTFIEVSSKAVMDLMRSIFTASGQAVPISPLGGEGTLPPILHVPARLEPGTPRLILCYFLVQPNATRLDDLLVQWPYPGVEFHCFTSKPLEATRSALRSHAKQRKLFQELFARCTGVIVSAGNETVWEAVCRGVPVLTIPTEAHGEQLLNAAVHQRNFPHLVRSRPRLEAADINWLVNFDQESLACAGESAALRQLVDRFNENGSPLLGGDGTPAGKPGGLSRRVSDALESARAWLGGGGGA